MFNSHDPLDAQGSPQVDLVPGSPDAWTKEILTQIPTLQPDDVQATLAWWQAKRQHQESLAAFLIRQRILNTQALKEIELFRKGYLSLGCVSHLLIADAAQRLLQTLSQIEPTQHTDETIASQPIERSVPSTEPELAFSHEFPTQTDIEVPSIHAPKPAPPRELVAGQTIGDYRLVRKLGRGPTGVVFEATGPEGSVALKALAPSLWDRTDAFLAAVEPMARVLHAHCQPITLRREPTGHAYVVGPLATQGSLADRLRMQGVLSALEATRCIHQAAIGLVQIHREGLAHGNLKPTNLLIDAQGRLRLTDLGLGNPTANGWLPAKQSDDLRLLTATYHQLLTGEWPDFEANSGRGPDRAPFSGESSFGPEIPASCQSIIERGLAGQYATAEAMEQDLAELHTLLQAGETSNVMSLVALDAETPSGWADGLIPSPSNQKGIEVGQTLGRCLLTEQIGQGATGLVFRAWHQTLNIPVAVKLLQLDCRNNDFVRRQFRTEARLLAQLNHPHVVRIWDFEDAAEQPYLVMEYVEGLTLADLIEQSGRLRLDRAVRIILHVAEALAAGQQLGIVHRDVKPANILLSRDGTAKLADLGLAMFASESSSPPAANQGSVAGTVAYMAPEQAVNAGTIDHRADQYALGGTFYQMLTGRLPFVSRSRMEMILKHANDLPEAPSRIVAELPPQVDHVVARMMAKRPAERYGNYAELIAALSELTSPRCVGPRASASGASSAGSGLWGSLIRKLTGSARASEGPA